mgnify:CR=1 FL=1
MQINANKVGLVWGASLGGFHLIWSILVLTGLGQIIMDFVFWAHMIYVPIFVGPFELTAAIVLVIFTAILGYCMGYAVAKVWNKVHAEAHRM